MTWSNSSSLNKSTEMAHQILDYYITITYVTTLETRRLRGDQIEVFKILNGYENIDSDIFLEIKESKIDLTRFNKIATQGAPQMAVDKEANSLSRVYSRLLF